MNWKGQLNKQEENKPQFVDPENQEDEEMERVEKFLGRFKKPKPMPFEEWMQALNSESHSLDTLVYFIINLDTTEGTPLFLLWEQKRQGKQSLPLQVKVLKDYGNDADAIVKNMVDEMKQTLSYTDVETAVRRAKLNFSSTLNIRRTAEPLLRQEAQKAEASPEVKQMREQRAAEKQQRQQREQQRQQQQQQQQQQQPPQAQQQQQQQPPQAQQQPQGGQ